MIVSLVIIPSKSGKRCILPVLQNDCSHLLYCSAIALSKIYLSSDPRLQNITVKGEIVVNPNGKVYIGVPYLSFVYVFALI
jgi:hypothetical protein